VLLNLIINAQHAMPAGGKLTVEARHVGNDNDTGHVVIAVADTGVGIPPDHLRRIFEPFFTTKGRLGESDTPGTGLGLSVAHGIITAHGGTIRVESEPGLGARFEVALPACEPAAAPEEEAAPRPCAPLEVAQRVATRVLVAEDAKMLSSLMRAILAGHGHEVTCVDDTEAALAALQSDRFDLVITDLLMPGGGGRQVLSFVRTLGDPPPVLVVTGVTEKHVEREALEMGAAAYIRKPFTRAELTEAVTAVLQGGGA
jgi:two-component system, cell cycle sensor histidine kinase and response regulator CckA